jgi:hypothetical protein
MSSRESKITFFLLGWLFGLIMGLASCAPDDEPPTRSYQIESTQQ